MHSLNSLQKSVRQGLTLVKKQPGLLEGVVYASSNRRSVGKIWYTSHIPSSGLVEPKSDENFGVSVEVWVQKNGEEVVGLGHEASDISQRGVELALKKAVRDAVSDPDFVGFLKPDPNWKKQKLIKTPGFFDPKLINLSAAKEAEILARMSWETIDGAVGAIEPYAKSRRLTPAQSAFILNGDNFLVTERMALSTTAGIEEAEESTIILSFMTAMLERENAKGSAWGGRLTLDGDSGYEIGRRAALAAINSVGGKRVRGGRYSVIFGPQAVTELFGNLLLPHANLSLVEFGASIFQGKYGQQVASPLLSLYDDATLPAGPGSKRITCEGCPTGRTTLIEAGRLVGYLSDWRTTSKVLKKRQEAKGKLGIDPHEIRHAISPRNGFRFSDSPGRIASLSVGIHATNLVVDSPSPVSEGDLLRQVENGIYIGRLWYTYPVGGYATGIISGTAIADSYQIKDGKLAEPILPNTLRLEDNIGDMVKRIIGIASNQIPTILWAADEITHAPWVGISDVNFRSIG